jgi:SAM-dependent methyltransferase
MDKELYYKLQKEEAGEWSGRWADQMINALLDYVANFPKTHSILDIGCNTGRSLFELKKNGYHDILGVDLISEKIKEAQDKDLPAMVCDMHDLSPIREFWGKKFDLCFMSHVIEHSLDPAKAINEMLLTSRRGLIICPIQNDKPLLGTDPHTSPFTSEEEWIDVWTHIADYNSIYHLNRTRLGKEVWTYFIEKKND